MKKSLYAGLAAACFATAAVAAPFGSNQQSNFISPTITVGAYASGNAIGGLIRIPTFRSTDQPSGIVDQIMVEFDGGETVGLVAYVFNSEPASATCADKTALSLSNTDARKLVTPPISLTPAASTGSTQSYASANVALLARNKDVPMVNNLYVCLVVTGAVTPAAATDLGVSISALQD